MDDVRNVLSYLLRKEATSPMRLLFCADPLDPRSPDSAFDREIEAARQLGIPFSLFSYEALVNEGSAARAVRRVETGDGNEVTVYRGWMLRPEHYTQLYDALLERGLQLINTPAAYRHCHYLPESYPLLEGHTPRTVWLPIADVTMDRIMALLEPFGTKPIIVKDYVKSQKHRWFEACFIPSASDRKSVESVVNEFLRLQGDDLNAGLVFREFVEFDPIGVHPRSGMPLTREYRTFVLGGKPLLTANYWAEGNYEGEKTSPPTFQELVQRVESRFFAMDVAKVKDGRYMVVELGDGQVSGLPETADPTAFIQALQSILSPTDGNAGASTPIDLTTLSAGQPEEKEPPKTLTELFTGRVGGVHGGGKAWSEDTGKAFSEGMAEKFGHDRGQSTP
jgi:hypothetical protein